MTYLSEFSLAEYEMGIRRLIGNVAVFSQIDPYAGKKPQVSPYSYCSGDPINFKDPTGLFESYWEAEKYLREQFPEYKWKQGTQYPVHRDRKTGEYYVALNENKSAPYETGATVSRVFKDPHDDYYRHAISVYGFSNDAKLDLIESNVNVKPGSDLGKYVKFYKGVGMVLYGIGVFNTVSEIVDYTAKGGKDSRVYYKYALDIAVPTIAMLGGGPVLLCGALLYFGLDLYTDGFGLDYSVKQEER